MFLIIFTKKKTVFEKPGEKDGIRIFAAVVAIVAAYMACGIFTGANAITMMIFWPLVGIFINRGSLEIKSLRVIILLN